MLCCYSLFGTFFIIIFGLGLGLEVLASFNITGDWSTEVSYVRRCQSILVRQQTQLELDALRDGKPVEAISQHVLDVVVLLGADD